MTTKDAIRIIRAVGRTIGETDTAQLVDLQALISCAETTMKHTIHALRQNGYTWHEIGRDLGVTRQNAQSRYGKYLCDDHGCTLCYWRSNDDVEQNDTAAALVGLCLTPDRHVHDEFCGVGTRCLR